MTTWRWFSASIVFCLAMIASADAPPESRDRPTALERWLEQVRRSDPAEHDRLVRLRREDRAAFGQEMRRRAREERIRRALEPHPELWEAFHRLTSDEQDRVLQQLGRGERGPPPRMTRRVTENMEQVRAVEDAVDNLLQAYLQANDEEERTRLAATLREEIARLYDHRTAAHEEVLKQMEQHLDEVRSRFKARGKRRDAWIRQRMEALLETAREED